MEIRVQEFREAQRLSKRELAKRAGITPRTIANIERGAYQPTVATASKLADALGVPLHVLFSSSKTRT